jgi:hypothetical protein
LKVLFYRLLASLTLKGFFKVEFRRKALDSEVERLVKVMKKFGLRDKVEVRPIVNYSIKLRRLRREVALAENEKGRILDKRSGRRVSKTTPFKEIGVERIVEVIVNRLWGRKDKLRYY